jgi:predicted metal-binding membrane protein
VPLRKPILGSTALLGGSLAAWVVTYDRMHGMDAGPGTDLGGLGWYAGVWMTMTAAMMLPALAPMVVTFSRISGRRRGTPAWAFLAGYLIPWIVYGLAAYCVYRAARYLAPSFLAWEHAGRYVAGGALALAGLYELTPLKGMCLRHCRGPLHFLLHGWRPGMRGALRMGFEHGLYCVGCCSGLMLALFALGVMSLAWMALIAALIFAEKVLPLGDRLAPVFAVAFVIAGLWVAVRPDTVPGLHVPGGEAPPMRMHG